LQWTDCEFAGRDFRDFNNADLSRLRTERVVFSECDFSGVNLAESEHRASAFRNCTFHESHCGTGGSARLRGYISPCSMSGSVFVQCRLRPLTFDEVDFSLAVLGGNDLRGVDMGGCRLRETSLVETDLRKAVLRGATIDASLCVDVSQALAYALAHGLRLDA
jgi:uncharacterized protein YjbI with pentapeptide repeats